MYLRSSNNDVGDRSTVTTPPTNAVTPSSPLAHILPDGTTYSQAHVNVQLLPSICAKIYGFMENRKNRDRIAVHEVPGKQSNSTYPNLCLTTKRTV